jgi:hypothetical protein
MSAPSPALDTALLALELGFSPMAPMENGSKRPLADIPDGVDERGRPKFTWKPYSEIPATVEHVRGWFSNGRASIGLATGYGDVECFEFDSRDTYEEFLDLASAAGLGDLVERIRTGYEEFTPGGGVHWLYRCSDRRGNTKLAERPDPNDPGKRDVLIETRGAGGFIIIAPSAGKVHDTGGAYTLVNGGLGLMTVLWPEEREALWRFARTFDEMPEQPHAKGPSAFARKATDGPPAGDVRPGDDFSDRVSWDEVLTPHGWLRISSRGDVTYWRRPGKDHGWSATTGHCKGLKVFSSSTPFDSQQTYTKFGAYAVLNHGGDFNATAKALAAKGHGSRPAVKATGGDPGAALSAPPVFDTDPRPITVDLQPVPALNPILIPVKLRGWLQDIADRGCFPIEYGAAAALVGLSGLLGRKLAIRPKRRDDWLVVPNLWGAAIGPPGIQKTPAVEEALRPLRRLAADAIERHKEAMANWESQKLIAVARKAAAKQALTKATKDGESDSRLTELARAAAVSEDEGIPIERRYIVNDSTVEKLGELLAQNPFGLTLFRDELTGFLKTMDRQGHESDRGFYLEAWNGFNNYTYDRIGRGTIHIPNVCLAIFGTIQPGPLAKYLRGSIAGEEEDGFIPRFQILMYPDPPAEFVNVDCYPETVAKNAAYEVFKALDTIDPIAMGCRFDEERRIPYIGFSDEAQDSFDEWRVDLEKRLRSGSLTNLMTNHLAKYRSLMPALALLFHVIDSHDASQLEPVSEPAAMLAAAWCDVLEAHASRIYQSAIDGDPSDAIKMSEKLKDSLPNPFTYRDVARKGWSGLNSTEDVRRAVDILEDRAWVKVVEIPSTDRGGRPTEKVYVHPKIVSGGMQP